MKHRMGNLPKCAECKYWRDKEPNDHCRFDGWCTKGKAKTKHWNDVCHDWIDAENGLTHYEVLTRQLEEWRTPTERLLYEPILKGR